MKADSTVVSGSGPDLSVHAPWDGALIGTLPTSTEEDIDGAIHTARQAQRTWAGVSPRQRARVAHRFGELVLEEQARILDTIQRESGKSRISAYEEVMDVARVAAYYAKHADSLLRPRSRRGAVPVLTQTEELRHPKGVVGVISPWNYPFTLVATDALPALLAGNAVVLKPDSQTPFTASLVVELLRRAGLPEEVFQLVVGVGAVVGPLLIDRVDFLMFTGSTTTGRTIAQQCAKRLIGFSAELGGKNPLLVLEDANPKTAASGAVKACFSNAGQLCISTERLYVNARVYDEFVDAFVRRTEALVIGAGFDWATDIGSLASRQQLDTVTAHVDDAVAKGAKVLAGGRARPDLGPLFYEPTILTDVPPEATLERDETFGPVVAITKVADDDEAIRLANDTAYGLNASVWSTSPAHAKDVAHRIHAGTVNINDGYAATWGSHAAPMGGWKDSGIGRRHGAEGILKYTESQTVARQRLHPIAPPPGMSNERFAGVVTRALRLFGRLGQ